MHPTDRNVAAEEILSLCEEIQMPGQVVRALPDVLASQFCRSLMHYAAALLSAQSAESAWQAMAEKAGSGNGMTILAVYLHAAVLSWAQVFEPAGISRQVYRDSMHNFTLYMNERIRAYQDINFDRGFWCWRYTCGILLRVGTLNYEMRPFANTQHIAEIEDGAPVLSIHIPSDAVLTDEALLHTYRAAHTFFADHFPGFAYVTAYTNTWLLSPRLRELLKPSSKILRFASDYRIVFSDPDRDDAIGWVFGKGGIPMDQLPQDTSLQRQVKTLMREGGHVGAALGILEHGGELYRADYNPFG